MLGSQTERTQTSVTFWKNINFKRDSLKTHRFPSQKKMPTVNWFRFDRSLKTKLQHVDHALQFWRRYLFKNRLEILRYRLVLATQRG